MEESFEFDSSLLDGAAAGIGPSAATAATAAVSDPNHGWQKVTYAKRQRRPQHPAAEAAVASDPDRQLSYENVFASVEKKAHDRRRAIESAAAAAAALEAGPIRSKPVRSASDDEDGESEADAPKLNGDGGEEVKKVKTKKPKKPKVTVAEAAAKIDAADLAAFLAEITASYESQQDIQLMRFADYFGRAFATVSASQFPWPKMLKESPVAKIADTPICYISEEVYKTSVDWIAQKSPDPLGHFVLWCLDGILADLETQQAAAKGPKKSIQQPPSKAQVAIFVILAMALRRKPDILISLLSKIKDNSKYQNNNKLPFLVWVIAQASHGDPVVGMYMWAHYLFPMVCGKSGGNPQSRDLIMQLVERILSGPKARPILLNGAVRKGERLVPPATFDLLVRMTFPSAAARIKATERFEAVYTILKDLALAGSPGTKTTKQVSQQLLPACVRAIQEDIPELTSEASDIFIWCLSQNSACYQQWEKNYLENIDASTSVLKKLSDGWKEYYTKLSPDALKETLVHLKAKNEEALSRDVDSSSERSIKEADKYCKAILGKLTSGSGCIKSSLSLLILVIVACLAVFFSVDSSEWQKIRVMLKACIPSISLE